MRKLLAYLTIATIPLLSFSQDFLSWQFNDRYFSFYVGTGSATYFGELNSNTEINARPSVLTTGLEARLLNHIGARFELSYLALSESDANAPDSSFQRQRNLSFESNNFQAQFAFTYYLKSYRGDYHKRWMFDPYLVGGVGYLNYHPATTFGGERFLLREAKTEGTSYSKWVLNVPLGVGAKFRINEFLNINAEVLYHITFTDYLDDVSGTYATEFSSSTAEFLSDRKDEAGVLNPTHYDLIGPGATRGNPDDNDSFLLVSIKAEIFIPPGLFSRRDKAVLKKPSAY